MANVLALVTFKVFPAHMGGQKGVALFYKHLAKYLNVTLAAPPDNDVQDAASYRLNVMPLLYSNKKILRSLAKLKTLEKLVLKIPADVLIAEHSYPAFLGLRLRKKAGTPLIIHSHNIEALRFQQMGRRWWKAYLAYERWVHRKADFSFFISEADQRFAINKFGLDSEKCAVITYGVEHNSHTSSFDKRALKRSLGFNENDLLFLFNGTLDYAPNTHAVSDLVLRIAPLLSSQLDNFSIVVTGSRATGELVKLLKGHPHIIYKGFVGDIETYYRSADLFVNPITNDTGVKTKVIEALANNCTVVSFAAGANGIPTELCGEKLVIVPDGDYEEFSRKVVELSKKEQPDIPSAFYDYYNWDNIAQKAATHIGKVINKHV